jgi:hypothetical protein
VVWSNSGGYGELVVSCGMMVYDDEWLDGDW